MFISDVIPVSVSDKNLLESNKEKLLKFGYEIDFISDTEVIFRKIPQILSKISPKDILADILENISGDIDNIEERILITTSCKAAVKGGNRLSLMEAEELLSSLLVLDNPYNCPHGRPVFIRITKSELEKKFKRIV